MSQTTSLELEKALDSFVQTIKHKANKQDRVGERTATSYRRNVRFFVDWLAEERDKTLLEAETSDLRVYLQQCVADGDKDNTIKTRRSAISRFYGELPAMSRDGKVNVAPDNCPPNPEAEYDATWTVSETHKQQQSGEKIQYLRPEEITSLYSNAPTPTVRNKLLARLLYQTAMRVSEATHIKLSHIDRDAREITVPAATSKSNSRTVAYKPSLDSLLRRWVDGGYRDAEHYAADSPFLFPTAQAERISRKTVRTVIVEAAESAGLDNSTIYTDNAGNDRKRINAHILRHSMAVNSLKAGTLNVRELQDILGHSDLETTEKYLKIASDDATDKYHDSGGPPEGD
jgi:integrase/recombinase XerD